MSTTGTLARIALAIALPGAVATTALAGERPAGGPQFEAPRIAAFAKKVERAIAERGARVALVSRVGRPRSELPVGIEFTHVAFAVYSSIALADGRTVPGYAIYNLYQDARVRNRSYLRQDYPLGYFAAVFELESGVIVPKAGLQRRLLELVGTRRYETLHNPSYSAISNPFTSKFQNCTEFVLDVLFAAVYGTADVHVIKAHEQAYFTPQEVRIDGLSLFFGSVFKSDITLSDHPGKVRTATFESIARFMLAEGLANEVLVVEAD